jgi:hypothetical protein
MNESSNHPNANGSRVLAWITLGFIIAFQILAFTHSYHKSGLWVAGDVALIVLLVGTVFINVNNTFETNAAWKTLLPIGLILLMLLLTTLPIAAHV